MKPSLPFAIQFRQDSIIDKGAFKAILSAIFRSTYWTWSEDYDTFLVGAAHAPHVCIVSVLIAAGAVRMRSVDEPLAIREEARTKSKETETDVEEEPATKTKKKKKPEVKAREGKCVRVRKSKDMSDGKLKEEPDGKRDKELERKRKGTSDGMGTKMPLPPKR